MAKVVEQQPPGRVTEVVVVVREQWELGAAQARAMRGWRNGAARAVAMVRVRGN
jgi:hypothetical protein